MGKIIDLFTSKEIPSESILTVTQSLIKSTNIKDRTHIDFTDPSNNNWEEVLQRNEVLTPKILIDQFQGVLATLIKGDKIDMNYCHFMFEQCKDWEESDKFIIVE